MESTAQAGNLGRRAVRGAAATGLSQLVRLVLQIASVVTLARLLSPRDYGLVAMVLAVIGVAEFLRDFGLGAAAVRAETLSPGQRDNLFWLNAGLGATFTAITAACAPLIADAYSRPELTAITLALAPTFLVSGLAAQYRVDLMRRLRFGALAWLEVLSAAIAMALGVVLAALGAGYWALVAQQVVSGLVALALLVGACRWRPGRYDRSTDVWGFVRLGSAFVTGGLLAYASRNVDNVLIGHQFGAQALGGYTRSVQLVRTPLTQLQGPFATVAVPVLVAAGSDDRRLLEAAQKGQVVLSYPVMAASAVIVAGSQPLVEVALGRQWLNTADLVAWIAVGTAASGLTTAAIWLFSVRGLGRAIVGYNLAGSLLTVLMIVVGGILGGVEGVAAGTAISAVVNWPVALLYANRSVRVPTVSLLMAGLRVGSVALVAGLVGRYAVNGSGSHSPWVLLVVAMLVVGLVFLASTAVVPGCRRDIRQIWTMVGMLVGRGTHP